jgi:hypothetical protein
MLPFGVTIPATVPQGSEIPEGLMNKPVLQIFKKYFKVRNRIRCADSLKQFMEL